MLSDAIQMDPEFVSEVSVPDQLTIDGARSSVFRTGADTWYADDKLEEEINAQLQKP